MNTESADYVIKFVKLISRFMNILKDKLREMNCKYLAWIMFICWEMFGQLRYCLTLITERGAGSWDLI